METFPDYAPKFSLSGMNVKGRVDEVVDGDTVKIVFAFLGYYFCWRCRLARINAPEIDSDAGIESKNYLESLILGKIIKVECKDFDKYGRVLVELFIYKEKDLICINNLMVDNGYAVNYK